VKQDFVDSMIQYAAGVSRNISLNSLSALRDTGTRVQNAALQKELDGKF
jgi:hypothetical protein